MKTLNSPSASQSSSDVLPNPGNLLLKQSLTGEVGESPPRALPARRGQRGFTLVEMMMSVSILGVLATLGTYSVRSHVASSKSVEALSMLGSMRANVVTASNGLDDAGLELGRSIAFGKAVAKKKTGGSSSGNGSSSSSGNGGGPKNDIDGDGNHGHGNNDGKCDPSNPGASKNCSAGNSGSGDSGSSGGDAVLDTGGKKDVDGDGNNGHGNDVGCDPSNPGNSQGCGNNGGGNNGGGNTGGGTTGGGDTGGGTTGGDTTGGEPGGGTAGGGETGGGSTGGGTTGGGSGSDDSHVWASESVRLCGNAAPVPASIEDVRGRRYQSTAASWSSGDSNSGWACLKMSRSEPQFYQYGYDVGGSKVSGSEAVEGDGAKFTAWARGDLDGDGRTSWFTLEGTVIDGQIVMAPSIQVVDADE